MTFEHRKCIFPTIHSAAMYVKKHPERINDVQYNQGVQSPNFPLNIAKFESREEVDQFARESEIDHFDGGRIATNNAAYLRVGWAYDEETGVWHIDENEYDNAIAIIADKIKRSARGPGILESGGRFGTDRLSAEAGGGFPEARRGVPEAGRGVPEARRGFPEAGRRLPTNNNELLTESDRDKLERIEREVIELSSSNPHYLVRTASIIDMLSPVISEDGLDEWTRHNKIFVDSISEKISALEDDILRLQMAIGLDEHTLDDAGIAEYRKTSIRLEIVKLRKTIKMHEAEKVKLLAKRLKPYTFVDIDNALKSLAEDILISNELIESEEQKLGEKLLYEHRIAVCNRGLHRILISEFKKRIQEISVMSASYDASELVGEGRRHTRILEIEKKIALLDLWRLSITYDGTESGKVLSRLIMRDRFEDLTELARQVRFRQRLYQGALTNSGMRAVPLELMLRAGHRVQDSLAILINIGAHIVTGGSILPGSAPIVGQATVVVKENLEELSSLLSQNKYGENNFSQRRLPSAASRNTRRNEPSLNVVSSSAGGVNASPSAASRNTRRNAHSLNVVSSSAGGVNSSLRRNRGSILRKHGRGVTPPESNASANDNGNNSNTSSVNSIEGILKGRHRARPHRASTNRASPPFLFANPKEIENYEEWQTEKLRRTHKNGNASSARKSSKNRSP